MKKISVILILLFFLLGLGFSLWKYGDRIFKTRKDSLPYSLLNRKDSQKLIMKNSPNPGSSIFKQRETLKKLQKKILSKGISRQLLAYLESQYRKYNLHSEQLLLCEQFTKHWYPASGSILKDYGHAPEADKKNILSDYLTKLKLKKIEKEIDQNENKNTIAKRNKRTLWQDKLLAPFCLDALYYNSFMKEFIEYLRQLPDIEKRLSSDNRLFAKLLAAHNHLKDYRQVAKLCEKKLLQITKSADLLQNCGFAHSHLKERAEARKFFAKAYKLNKDPDYIREIAEEYREEGKYEKAADVLAKIPR